MENFIYFGCNSLQDLKRLLDKLHPNPTNTLIKMMLRGDAFQEFEKFLEKNLTPQFSLKRSNWFGLKSFVRCCEKNSWNFSLDIEDFIKLKDPKNIFQLLSIGKNSVVPSSGNKLEKIVKLVSKRVQLRVDSIDSVHQFPKTGIEAWFKVEVVAALGGEVVKLNNLGPDLTLADGTFIELKAATDFNPSYLRDGAIKYCVPCLFLGDGEQSKYIDRLKIMPVIRVISMEYIYGDHTWVMGCIEPNFQN